MSDRFDGLCWANGPEHDWVPDGDYWRCDRCGAEEDDD